MQEPWSATLRNDVVVPAPSTPTKPAGRAGGERDAGAAPALLDRFRKEMGKSVTGVIPVQVTVPALGPSFFVAAELTAESQAPALEIKYAKVNR
jgi:hypothetical protein